MSHAHQWADEPRDLHEARCAIWRTHSDPCTCRDDQGHAPTLHATRAQWRVLAACFPCDNDPED